MTARRIDGKEIAAALHAEIRVEAERLYQEKGIQPGLATLLVGEDPASHSYVRAKRKACERDGIASFHHELPAETSEEQLLALIGELAADTAVHGILVQLPLPGHIDERRVIDAIPPAKDVDGFHPANLGQLGLKDGNACFAPCTPAGVLEMLRRIDCRLSGARAVVLGRSRIVGLPAAMLLLRENATVTLCHSRTQDLAAVTREADVLVAAIGRAKFVTADMVKPGAVVIDVGVNRVDDSSRQSGYRLVGDCEFAGVSEVASAITPVPGGVGPMTIAMLMKNTLTAALRS
ncbi:MAG: bifunctional methylenetetrahydrofolate dehydrogenase/methenyltetrahydrofolate cyclohydrolase FolD [Planctomycetota bacterium]|nr:MAG: bifunctional methylenetetrahydrofolate dehydrogenase/methenyltetrahydrofolate cyclohydrolase FolD [Planctomycetota bacterium]